MRKLARAFAFAAVLPACGISLSCEGDKVANATKVPEDVTVVKWSGDPAPLPSPSPSAPSSEEPSPTSSD